MGEPLPRRRFLAGLAGGVGVGFLGTTVARAAGGVTLHDGESVVVDCLADPTASPSPTAEPSPEPSPEPTGATIVSGDHPDGFTVPAGQTWQIDGLVTTPANVIVEGRLVMRPGSTLRFRDVDESRFVGGGMSVLASDVGLWVIGSGVLDIQGTPRAGWNRTGTDPTWQAGDEVLSAPIEYLDREFHPFTPGGVVPRAYPEVPPTEVLNLTRDVVIEGTTGGRAHVSVMSDQPQRIKYALLRHLAPAGATGRYALHFHHCGEGSRGSVVEGVVVRDSGRAFVPHRSHGIVQRDCIAFDIDDIAFWWDPPEDGRLCRIGQDSFPDSCNFTDDTVWEHCLAARAAGDVAFMLGGGHHNVCVDSVAVACTGRQGFFWPATANLAPNVWRFEDCVAHNNAEDGLRVWQNDKNAHIIDRFTSYHNRRGLQHGAYGNAYRYRDVLLIANGHPDEWGAMIQHASSDWNTVTETPHGYERVTIDNKGRAIPCVLLQKHQRNGEDMPIEMVDCRFYPHGGPAVQMWEDNHPSLHDFVRCLVDDRDMEPSDVHIRASAGCTVRGQRRDGTAWQINPDTTVSVIDAFHA